ncbi:hhaIM [Symbiodinium sp. CCMP2456]|nr:hhaIM [Symbiodinium sp. CCMP2456]
MRECQVSLVSGNLFSDAAVSLLMAGSTCKDWSSMGKAHGFFGPNGIAFVVMIAVVQKIKPIVFLHENTRSFDFSMLAFLLSDSYQLHHTFLKPEDFGCPAKRTRSYSALIRKDHDLERGLDEMFRMTTLTHDQLDCGAFLLAPAEEVHELKTYMAKNMCRGVHESWEDLLPVSARAHLGNIKSLDEIKQVLQGQTCEVGANLDQDIEHSTSHVGKHLPVILASTTYMWALLRNRPFTAKDLCSVSV